jgi:hypothetical protein
MADDGTETEIQAKGLTAPRVTPVNVMEAIASEWYFTAHHGACDAFDRNELKRVHHRSLADRQDMNQALQSLKLVTICVLLLRNGHKIVGVNTGPVSSSNFNAELAQRLAREHAISQVWPLLGYQLRERLFNLPAEGVSGADC